MKSFHVASAVLAESSFIHWIGAVFHPVFVVLGMALAAIYGLTASYGLAIVVLTIVIMALLMPLSITSTRSIMAMQRLQPKFARLRQKYKGPENREQLKQEMLRIYKEERITPAASCLPALLQLPLLIVLYDVIKGLTDTFTTTVKGHAVAMAQPRYIPTSSRLYHDLVASHGAMNWLGINLALKPFAAHAQWFGVLPYVALILFAVVLQYVQLAQAKRCNPAAARANPQMQQVQRVMPIVFACMYMVIPVAMALYMIVSTTIRIVTQHVLFRHGIAGSPPPPARAGPPV